MIWITGTECYSIDPVICGAIQRIINPIPQLVREPAEGAAGPGKAEESQRIA
jgi:hypothetical protein